VAQVLALPALDAFQDLDPLVIETADGVFDGAEVAEEALQKRVEPPEFRLDLWAASGAVEAVLLARRKGNAAGFRAHGLCGAGASPLQDVQRLLGGVQR